MKTMVSPTANENLLKLKKLSDQICEHEKTENLTDKYRNILLEIKKIVDSDIVSSTDTEAKLKRFERVCAKIRLMVEKLNLA